MSEEKNEEVDIDDEALAMAAGGLSLPNSPTDLNSITFSTNSTIIYSPHH